MVTVADQPQHMKAPYIHLPKVYSDFILTQEHTWAFKYILTKQGECIRTNTEWIKSNPM